ncbi:hypothetical protein ACET3Z_028568 [Daucus carota]
MACYTKETKDKVKDILQRLDWDALYQYHQHQMEVTRDQFHGFIGFAVKLEIDQAMFYNSVQNLFRRQDVNQHLNVLSRISGSHFPSSFAFVFFKAVYRPSVSNETAEEMVQLLNANWLRSRLLDLIKLLEDMYYYIITERDYLLPARKFCPKARNLEPLNRFEGNPFEEELWDSLCNRTVQGNYRNPGDIWGNPLTIFAKFLMACYTKETKDKVKDILQRLDWDALYQYHQHQMEVTRDQFHGFIGFAVKLEIDQAMFYNSVQNLFRRQDVNQHLNVLSRISGSHFPSSFAFVFFKAVYRPSVSNETAEEMVQLLNANWLRSRLLDLIKLLEDMYYYIITERDYLLPARKFCPKARNLEPLNRFEGNPFEEELWDSLCNRTVQGNYRNPGDIWGNPLTMSMIWSSSCQHCKLQLILFKILLSAMSDYN